MYDVLSSFSFEYTTKHSEQIFDKYKILFLKGPSFEFELGLIFYLYFSSS